MKLGKATAALSRKNTPLSLAVQDKFFLLLLIAIALIFDTVSQQPDRRLFDNRVLPEIPETKIVAKFDFGSGGSK